MSAGAPAFALVRLDCPTCGAPVAAEGVDVVAYCTACGNGFLLGDGGQEDLTRVEVDFLAAPAQPALLWRPFWRLPAQVELRRRQGAGGGLAGLLALFTAGEARAGEAPTAFAVPAFAVPLAAAVALTGRYTAALPSLGERRGEGLTGACYGQEDARRLAHFVLLAGEVAKPDLLTDLEVRIDFGPARLLGVPFVRRGERLADAYFAIEV